MDYNNWSQFILFYKTNSETAYGKWLARLQGKLTEHQASTKLHMNDRQPPKIQVALKKRLMKSRTIRLLKITNEVPTCISANEGKNIHTVNSDLRSEHLEKSTAPKKKPPPRRNEKYLA